MQTSIESLNKTVQKTNEWLTELAEERPFDSKEHAYTALRAVLHAVRDRLLIDQAVHFASEFPLLIKGIYFDNWDPAVVPSREKTKEEFLEHIGLEMRNARYGMDPEQALKAVFSLLTQKISQGAIEKAKQQLPLPIRSLIANISHNSQPS